MNGVPEFDVDIAAIAQGHTAAIHTVPATGNYSAELTKVRLWPSLAIRDMPIARDVNKSGRAKAITDRINRTV